MECEEKIYYEKKLVSIICIVIFFCCSSYVFVNDKKKKNSVIIEQPVVNENSIEYYKFEYAERYHNYQEKHPELSVEDIITMVNIGLDNDFYTNIKKAPNIDTNYILVNKYHYLESDYVPNNLQTISEEFSVEGRFGDLCFMRPEGDIFLTTGNWSKSGHHIAQIAIKGCTDQLPGRFSFLIF